MAKRHSRTEKYTEDELRNLVDHHIQLAEDNEDEQLSGERVKATKYYYGDKFGNEVDGRSSFVTSDVQDVVESMMPDFLEIFAGSDQPVEFTPTGPEDEDFAKQATEYCNHIWNNDNDGFGITYDWIKTALLNKNGYIYVDWREDSEVNTSILEKVSSLALQELEQDDEVKIIESDQHPEALALAFGMPDGILYDLKVERTENTGRVHIEGIPPEYMLKSPGARTIDKDDSSMVGARFERTVSELIEEGYDEDLVREIPSYDNQFANRETQARLRNSIFTTPVGTVEDELTRVVAIYHCFLHVDWDGDGQAEYRQVTVAGPDKTILYNEAVEDHNFIDITPIRMPYTNEGRSIADLVMPLQFIRSTIFRQILDNAYQINNARTAVSKKVNMDDYLSNRVGGAVRVTTDGSVGEHIMPLVTQPLAPSLMPVVESINQERETRTGQTRYNQGLDANSLNDTASGINMILGEAQKRKLLMARLFAETGFRLAFKKILKLVVTHQDKPRMIRLRGEFVEMDPRHWNVDMDVTINVGLGHGTRQEKLQMANQRMMVMEKGLTYQGGMEGPFYTPENVYKHMEDFYNSTGIKSTDTWITDPSQNKQPPKEKGPTPEQVLAQIEQQKMQLSAEETKIEDRRKREEMAMVNEREMTKIMLEDERDRLKITGDQQNEQTKLQLEAEKILTEGQRDAAKSLSDREIKEQELALKDKAINVDAAKSDEQNRISHEAAERDSDEKGKDREHSANEGKETRNAASKTKSGGAEKKGADQVVNLTIEDKGGKKKMKIKRDGEGNITGADVE